MARRQLMQEYAQKSSTTTLPRRDCFVSGFEFSQPVTPASSGMSPSTTGAPEDLTADIIAPPALPLSGFAAIIIDPAASGFGAMAVADSRFEKPATVTGFATHSFGSTRSKFRTFGRSL